MRIEQIIIGDEILSGRVQDLNIKWLSIYLRSHGFEINQVTITSDDQNEIIESIQLAYKRADLIITTGGLGPTQDDQTKQAVAKAFNKKLAENSDATKIVENNYKRINKEWGPKTNYYHHIPIDFIACDNPAGLAPGLIYINKESPKEKIIMCAPGVPVEFQKMMSDIFMPLILENKNFKSVQDEQLVIKTHGIPEEKIFFELCPDLWSKLSKFGKVSSLPQIMGINIIVKLNKPTQKNEVIELIQKEKIAPNIWQIGDVPLPNFVIDLLKQKGKTLAVAESCTGGLIASRITDISGCSSCFNGGAVTYSNDAKVNILKVNPKTIEEFGAVSTETAREMAEGALKHFKSDYAVSTSGVAGPSGGSKEKPVGLVAIGVASQTESFAAFFQMHGDRETLKKKFSERALFQLLKTIQASSK
jgi:nicotinamide-nucleotide amidase